MKKLIVSATVVMVVAGASSLMNPAWGQARTEGDASPHKIGLIDMAHIFKEYKKFNVLRDDLKAKIEESDSKAKSMANEIKRLQTDLGKFKSGTPEYSDTEQSLAKASADFEAFRKLAQNEFLREESQIYKTIYLEVTDTVKKYASHYQYTLIMRFQREGLENADDPNNVIKGMNRQVVYFRPQDDITDDILKFLNDRYSRDGGAPAAAAPRGASGNTKKSATR